MPCSIMPIFMDIDCPKKGSFERAQTLGGKVERVERGFEKGTIYVGRQTVFHVNKAVPEWVITGIMVEINIKSDGTTTIQQANDRL